MTDQTPEIDRERKSINMEKGAIEIVDFADQERRNRNFSLTVNQIIYEWAEMRALFYESQGIPAKLFQKFTGNTPSS